MPKVKRPKILIVDDVPANIKMLREVLKSNYDIIFATNGLEAVELLKSSELPDLILLDIMMPGMDGYEVCGILKSDALTAKIPIIFITSKDDEEDEVKGFELGAVDYVTKPFSIPVVKARVQTHVELKQQREILENLSSVDGLTGIPNRRNLDDFLERNWHFCMRASKPISLIMIDIDHFKTFNDQYGHLEGDECLKKVAAILKSCINRDTDIVARYGGEEFACVLPVTDMEGALSVAESMRKSIEALSITHVQSCTAGHVTISLGVASMVPLKDAPAVSIIKSADRALYAAKMSSRNCVKKAS
jgi:two-component system sensor histidine kinase/response regulator